MKTKACYQTHKNCNSASCSKYRKNTLEAKLEEILPIFPSYVVIAHELTHDGEGWSVNDSWKIARDCDREEAISHLRGRWEIFRLNYAKKARVSDIQDQNWSGEGEALLEVDCLAFATVRNANE